jgi:hypothetical protein
MQTPRAYRDRVLARARTVHVERRVVFEMLSRMAVITAVVWASRRRR